MDPSPLFAPLCQTLVNIGSQTLSDLQDMSKEEEEEGTCGCVGVGGSPPPILLAHPPSLSASFSFAMSFEGEGLGCGTIFRVPLTTTFGEIRRRVICALGGGFKHLVFPEEDFLMRTAKDEELIRDRIADFPDSLAKGRLCYIVAARACDACASHRATKDCSGCHKASYCSAVCQLIEWRNGHRSSCPGVKVREELKMLAIERDGLSLTLAMMARRLEERDGVITKMIKEARGNNELDRKLAQAVLQLSRTRRSLDVISDDVVECKEKIIREREQEEFVVTTKDQLEYSSPLVALDILSEYLVGVDQGRCDTGERALEQGGSPCPRPFCSSDSCSSCDSVMTAPPLELETMGLIMERLGSLSKMCMERIVSASKGCCSSCLTEPRQYAPVSCGHLSLCSGCVEDAVSCPVCHTHIEETVRIFIDQ